MKDYPSSLLTRIQNDDCKKNSIEKLSIDTTLEMYPGSSTILLEKNNNSLHHNNHISQRRVASKQQNNQACHAIDAVIRTPSSINKENSPLDFDGSPITKRFPSPIRNVSSPKQRRHNNKLFILSRKSVIYLIYMILVLYILILLHLHSSIFKPKKQFVERMSTEILHHPQVTEEEIHRLPIAKNIKHSYYAF